MKGTALYHICIYEYYAHKCVLFKYKMYIALISLASIKSTSSIVFVKKKSGPVIIGKM